MDRAPGSASLATGQPQPALPTYPDPYGVWDPNFTTRSASVDPAVKPWAFWQNGSGAPNGFTVDYNAANGNIEYVKDFLVPALWTNTGKRPMDDDRELEQQQSRRRHGVDRPGVAAAQLARLGEAAKRDQHGHARERRPIDSQVLHAATG